MIEEWKPVVGYEGLYEVSNLGRIRSQYTNRILSPIINAWGYYCVNLYKDGKGKKKTVHRLVAYAFIPETDPNKDQINHKNEIKTDNRVENLEWCTVEYNNLYGSRKPKYPDLSRKERAHLRYIEHRDEYKKKSLQYYYRKKMNQRVGGDVSLW